MSVFDRGPGLRCMLIHKLHFDVLWNDEQLSVCVSITMRRWSYLGGLMSVCRNTESFILTKQIFHPTAPKTKSFVLFSFFLCNLFCLHWFDLIYLAPSFPSTPFLSFTYPFFESHLRLAGMSHRSNAAAGSAPVILRVCVHLFEQWINKVPEARAEPRPKGLENSIYLKEAELKDRRSNMVTTCH